MLNSLVYDVEFPDGVVKQYAANIITENLLSQIDSSGHYSQALECIVQHERVGNVVDKKQCSCHHQEGRTEAAPNNYWMEVFS